VGFVELRRWPDLDRLFVAQFESGTYEETVNQDLERYRRKRGAPHYFALFTLFDDDEVRPKLEYYDELVNKVGKTHVHMFAVQRRTVSTNGRSECTICSYRVGFRKVTD